MPIQQVWSLFWVLHALYCVLKFIQSIPLSKGISVHRTWDIVLFLSKLSSVELDICFALSSFWLLTLLSVAKAPEHAQGSFCFDLCPFMPPPNSIQWHWKSVVHRREMRDVLRPLFSKQTEFCGGAQIPCSPLKDHQEFLDQWQSWVMA